MTLRKRAPAPDSTKKETVTISQNNAKEILDKAMESSPSIFFNSLYQCFGNFMDRKIEDLANIEGNAATILIAQSVIYFKRNYGECLESIKNKKSTETEAIFNVAKIIAANSRNKEII